MLKSRTMLVAIPMVVFGAFEAPAHDLHSNRVTFDHAAGKVIDPVPTKLYLHHGEAFVVEVRNTDPAKFRYAISVIEGAGLKSGGQIRQEGEAQTTKLTSIEVTWQHDSAFQLYEVNILAGAEPAAAPKDLKGATEDSIKNLLRTQAKISGLGQKELTAIERLEVQADLQELNRSLSRTKETLEVSPPPTETVLRSYKFPVWVETIGWKPSFTGGFAFSDLTSDDYFLESDDQGTADVEDDEVTVRKADRRSDEFKPDVIALASFTYARPGENDWGLSFGAGLDDEANPRYYLGAHYSLGTHVRLAAGVAGGRIDVLKGGWRANTSPPDSAATAVPMEKRFRTGFFIGIGFSIADRETEFKGTLGGAQESAPAEK